MTHAISWARPKKVRKAVVTALAVTMVSAGQPASPAAPATPAKPPAARRAPKPAAPKVPRRLVRLQQHPLPQRRRRLPAQRWKCRSDDAAKQVCFTGKDARTEAGQPVIAAALIEPDGEPKKLFRITLPTASSSTNSRP